jgi:hypothetical protein
MSYNSEFGRIFAAAPQKPGFSGVPSSRIRGWTAFSAPAIPCAALNLTHNSGNAYLVPRREFTAKSKKSKK